MLSNLKSAPTSLEDAFNTHFVLVRQASTFSLPNGGSRSNECYVIAFISVTFSSEALLQEYWLIGNTGQRRLHLRIL